MEWSMARPEFKLNLFRLIDVLPSLRSNKAVAEHIREYLAPVAREMGGAAALAFNFKPSGTRGLIMASGFRYGVKQMAQQFIAGESPENGVKAIKSLRKKGLAFTVDLLGEYSHSESDAQAYLNRYLEALDTLHAKSSQMTSGQIINGHPAEQSPLCLSVKLTALYSQCDPLNYKKSISVLSERLKEIAMRARRYKAQIYIDAEDMESNSIIYPVFKKVFLDSDLIDYPFPGIVVQCYAKNSEETVQDLLEFAAKRATPIAVRLVKGAYWDYETVLSAQHHRPSPLFSKKSQTDENYNKLAAILLDNSQRCLPAFASHNIHSLSYACCYAFERGLTNKDFELQMLYGMADPIAKAFADQNLLVRLYVPVGELVSGMGYLIRRLLENTSNESFLRHVFHS